MLNGASVPIVSVARRRSAVVAGFRRSGRSIPGAGVAILAAGEAWLPIASGVGLCTGVLASGLRPMPSKRIALSCSLQPDIEAVHRDAPMLERRFQCVDVVRKQVPCRNGLSLDRARDPALLHLKGDFYLTEFVRGEPHRERATALSQNLRKAALDLR